MSTQFPRGRLCLYFRKPPETDRWIKGDRFLRPSIRRILRGKGKISGLERVFVNLCLGLDRIGMHHVVNLPFHRLEPDDHVAVLGLGRHALRGYDKPNPIVAGIGLMTHPNEWPDLFEEYPVSTYLQHSHWTLKLYQRYFGNRCQIWPAGIDTDYWHDSPPASRHIDFLIYKKILWDAEKQEVNLLEPIRRHLQSRKLRFEEIEYGNYRPPDYKDALARCRGMIFLCEHESQGLACQEAMSFNTPVLAWNQGIWLDPNRFRWGTPEVEATSIPYWNDYCGVSFKSIHEFSSKLDEFIEKQCGDFFRPREYILNNLTLERSARRFLDIVAERTPR